MRTGTNLRCGNLFDILPTLAATSIDACVTDPPYGIGFMGKEWDSFSPGVEQSRIVANTQAHSDNPNLKGRARGPASSPSAVEYDRSLRGQRAFQDWTAAWGREVLRVLKPGAHCVVFGAPRAHHRMISGLEDAGFEVRDCLAWLFGQGYPKSRNLHGDWEGWGTALKPGYEPIVLARKPFTGTLTANVSAWGTGGLHIDACRVGIDTIRTVGTAAVGTAAYGDYAGLPAPTTHVGRWPANVVLDEDAGALLDMQSGPSQSGRQTRPVGGASRFFYCAKASTRERNIGCTSRNTHPTVKPISLMRWLVKLVTPPDGVVLDPFLGSGTTGVACRYEGVGFVGIEREPEYIEIAHGRVASVA